MSKTKEYKRPSYGFEQFIFHVEGSFPGLLMHNGQLADPSNEFAKRIKKVTSIRADDRTAEDSLELKRAEWMGGLNLTKDGEPCIRSDQVEAALIKAAKKKRQGEAFSAGVYCFDDSPLVLRPFAGRQVDLDELFQMGTYVDTRGVVVTRKRILRTRPVFPEWSALIPVNFMPSVIDGKKVVEAMEVVSTKIGIGDRRPRYGRFEIKSVDHVQPKDGDE